jgi:hypothetical protein
VISSLFARLVALWDDSWFFQVNVVVLVTGFLFLVFVW